MASADQGTDASPFGKIPERGQLMLQNFLQARPEIKLPPMLAELQGTHGWFCGDGREEREIVVGFQPKFVVFTVPVFPDGPRRMIGKDFFEPPLHAQPEFTERGFKIGLAFNKVNTMSMYVVWKA
jgi:hypothetical protein